MEYINLKAQYQDMREEINAAVLRCMSNADFIMGDAVNDFESRLAEYVGVKYAVSCGSGTDALQMIYMLHGIGAGDAVFCPAMTFIASVEPACLLGATPIFCDIDHQSYNILPESLERQIQNVMAEGRLNPKAVVAVDFLGNPADYDNIRKITKKYGLLLIEDAAQSMGAVYKGKKCGSLGDIAATSFFPSKPLGAYGDGGAVFTDDAATAEILKSLRTHGKGKSKYDNVRVGLNSRLDTIQAEILKVKLEYLEMEIEKRQGIAEFYFQKLDKSVKTPFVNRSALSSFAQFVICMRDHEERDGLRDYLKKNEIPTIIYYPNPLHLLPVFCEMDRYGEDLSNAERYAKTNLGIPFSPYISEAEQTRVMEVVNKFFQEEEAL